MNTVEAKKGFKTFVLIASAALTAFGAYKEIPRGYYYLTQAKQQDKFKNLQIKSLSPSSITITCETETEARGFVAYGTDPDDLNRVAPETTALLKHEITIENLTPQTTYYYKIGLDGKVLGKTPYQFTTPGN